PCKPETRLRSGGSGEAGPLTVLGWSAGLVVDRAAGPDVAGSGAGRVDRVHGRRVVDGVVTRHRRAVAVGKELVQHLSEAGTGSLGGLEGHRRVGRSDVVVRDRAGDGALAEHRATGGRSVAAGLTSGTRVREALECGAAEPNRHVVMTRSTRRGDLDGLL